MAGLGAHTALRRDGPRRATSHYAYWSLLLLFVYYDVDRWAPLGGWNGNYHWPVHNDQFSLDIIVGVVLLGAMLAFRRELRAGMIASVALLGLWSYFHVVAWWLPYLRGVTSPGAVAFHVQFLAHTQILPRLGNHYPPDAEHACIDVLVFAAFVLCLVATVRSVMTRSPGPPPVSVDRITGDERTG